MNHNIANLIYGGRLIIGLTFFALGYYVIITNILGVLTAWIYNRNYSSVPFFGGIFLAIGMLLIPDPLLNCLFWVAFLVDYTFPMFVWFIFYMAYDVFLKNKEK